MSSASDNKKLQDHDAEVIIVGDEGVRHEEKGPHGERNRIKVDNEHFWWPHDTITGSQILELVRKSSETHYVEQHIKGNTVPIEPDQVVDLSGPGVEKFTTGKKQQTEGR